MSIYSKLTNIKHDASYGLKRLDRIRNLLNSPGVDYTTIYEEVNAVFAEIGYYRKSLSIPAPFIQRSVVNSDPDWFNNANRLGCPPKEVVGLGRCNWSGEPVFYGSMDNTTPIHEVRAKKGDYVVISVWISKDNLDVSQYPDPNKPIWFRGVPIGVEQLMKTPTGINKILKQDSLFNKRIPNRIKEIDKYFGRLFADSATQTQNLYWFTSAVSKIYFENFLTKEGWGIDGLLFPSVEANYGGCNIVLTKTFFDQRVHLGGADMYKVLDYDEKTKKYELKAQKRLVTTDLWTNKLIWKNFHSRHDNESFIITPHMPCIVFDPKKVLTLEDD